MSTVPQNPSSVGRSMHRYPKDECLQWLSVLRAESHADAVLKPRGSLPNQYNLSFIARNPLPTNSVDEFRRLLEQLVTYRCPLVIVGDLNVHLEKADCTYTKRFNRLLKSFVLLQHVADPTHNQGGILDVFNTRNDLPNPDLFVHAPSISDHSLIEGHLHIQPENVFETFTTRSWSKFDKTKFKQDLFASNFFSQGSNWANFTIDELFSNYNFTLRTLLDKHLYTCAKDDETC